ncbi:Pigl [Nucleospora cyclopteri]
MIILLILKFFPIFNTVGLCLNLNSILLIAHPDDESMFFTPLIRYCSPTIICLSCKNTEREKELKTLCIDRGFAVHFADFKDGEDWKVNEIVKVLLTYINHNVKTQGTKITVFTFDSLGVSYHKNHKSCFEAAKIVENELKSPIITFKYLKTHNFLQKYVFNLVPGNVSTYPLQIFHNMSYHKSQLRWYRYLWMIFSNYSLSNSFY